MDKAIQVCGRKKKISQISSESQTCWTSLAMQDASTQHLSEIRSYEKYRVCKVNTKWTYDRVKEEIICNKDRLIEWLINEKLIASSRKCGYCNEMMKIVVAKDRSDGYKWECRRQINGKRYKVEMSIRKDSWFEKSNLSLEEIVKLTYWWCRGLKQDEICHEVSVSEHTAVDWDSFCRETYEVTLLEKEHKIGDPGKTVQIDESKFGKRKYHRGHKVEGQWVFGGIEEETQRSFMVAVEKRDEKTLLPIIQQHIAEGTTIVSDCWKAYTNLDKHGYAHKCVNHSKEFVNVDGDHTNKIGHWRQAKAKMPSFGVRKYMFSSHLAEFLWRYEHKGKDLFETFLLDVKKLYGKF